MRDTNGEEWLTVTEAAKAVRVRPSTIWNWRSRGKVRGHRIGRHAYVHLGDVQHAEAEWRARVVARSRNR